MSLLICLFWFFLAVYVLILSWLAYGFLRSRAFTHGSQPGATPVTIIICALNEEDTIEKCLGSIITQSYDKGMVQIILVDDHSTDQTRQKAGSILKVSGIDHMIISNEKNLGKKQSITRAIENAKHELIVLRDADTFTASPGWIRSIAGYFERYRPDMIIAPIAISEGKGLLWAIQVIENNILQLAACGSAYYNIPFLSGAANLAFTKAAFYKAGGYRSNKDIFSGDDVFLMEDIRKTPGAGIHYLRSDDAFVFTHPVRSLPSLVRQKTRWASKFRHNKNPLNLVLALVTFAVNALMPVSLLLVLIAPGWKTPCLLFILLKGLFDILLLFLASGFMKSKNTGIYLLPVACVYPFYACLIAFRSLFVRTRLSIL